jgi:ATP-dependent Clp protease ATP-binding subunit ClpB
LRRVGKLLKDRGLSLELTEAARELLIKEGYDPQYGARPMRRAIQRLIQDPLALKLLNGDFQEGDIVEVDADPAASELLFRKSVGQDSSPARVLQDPLLVGLTQ